MLDTSGGAWITPAPGTLSGEDVTRRCRHAVTSVGPFVFIYGGLKSKHKGGLFAVYVKSTYRASGLGKRLVDQVIVCAKSKVLQLHCAVTVKNTSALSLYQSLGFVQYGVEPKALKIGEQFYDEILMVKQF